jgi:opacity protein-like surface antigen
MRTRNVTLAVAIAAALALPATASARGVDFNYFEANYVNVDVDYSETFVLEGDTFTGSTDADDGFQAGAAFQISPNVHLFGEYSKAKQDFDVTVNTFSFSGDFDVIRWRIGIGYAIPVSNMLSYYGRISYDSTQFKDMQIEGDVFASDKDDGVGGELGLLWAATPVFHVQTYVRYTDVGKWDDVEVDTFDSDVLFGAGARWFVTDNFAVQAGFEYGEISTWSVGGRIGF